ncbi:MAG: DUF4845 domain-containing protein [Oxalobacteraceae bacterium]|jgi:type II secretory pathway pseudopilin PulG|nr:DUF4845 domain-containing protein [Oxalobacteraceae bacterium]
MRITVKTRQQGLTLTGLIFVLAIVAVIAVLGMKVVPTAIEYSAIRKSIVSAKDAGTTVAEIRAAFDRQANAGYIDAIAGKDLDIAKVDGETVVGFAYQKKIPLFGPASLLLEYSGTTAKISATKAID